jgi:predicted TIM-barrel fold metal-dependent hydrolase
MRQIALIPLLGIVACVALPSPQPVAAQDPQEAIGDAAANLPLFDAHMHWKQPAWSAYPPDTVLALMDRSGVAMALVSSSPDDGTITLWQYAPNRIVPEMRPYNDRLGPSNWTRGEGVGDYIEARVRQYPHEGIGEFHLNSIDPRDEPLLKRIIALAIEKNIPLHVHSGHEAIEYLYSLDANLTIIWAHAGMTEPAAVVEEMMARYPSLHADTSYRETDILHYSGEIDAEWRRLLERFADRFMVGSDTWINAQWANYDRLMARNRDWLAHLSPAAASKIAYQNAERLFARKLGPRLFGTR